MPRFTLLARNYVSYLLQHIAKVIRNIVDKIEKVQPNVPIIYKLSIFHSGQHYNCPLFSVQILKCDSYKVFIFPITDHCNILYNTPYYETGIKCWPVSLQQHSNACICAPKVDV